MNEAIRVARREKRITVNDNGDYITIPLDTQDFLPALLALMREFEERAKAQQERAKILADKAAGPDREAVEEITGRNLEDCREMSQRLDALFGEGSCTKIFGAGVPSLFAFADFFDQLAPIVGKFAREEAAAANKRVQKYTAKYRKEAP